MFEGFGQAGSVVTAGGLVFVGSGSNIAGYFLAFDAKTGELLWKFNTGAGVFSSPSMYMVNGEQFVTVGVGRRRARPAGRRSDSQLRAAEVVSMPTSHFAFAGSSISQCERHERQTRDRRDVLLAVHLDR